MDGVSAWIENLSGQARWMPDALIGVLTVAAFIFAGLIAHWIVFRTLGQMMRRSRPIVGQLIRRARRPTRWAFIVVAARIGMSVAPLGGGTASLFAHALTITVILLCGWYALIAVDVVAKVYLGHYRIDVADNLLARKHVTQIRILHRAVATLIVILTAAAALMTIHGVRQYGVSLLAAGGAAGIVVGLALQPLLTNLIAGIQIAMTQPIRIDDAVIVEGEWGRVEEITATYVVVCIWDWRRLILPLSYVIQNPFQNWTRETARLIGSAYFYVDLSAPVAAMRNQLDRILKDSRLWDGEVKALQVTDCRERVMEVRAIMSAANSGDAWELRCLVREKMLAWLKAEHPSALPRTRVDIEDEPGRLAARS